MARTSWRAIVFLTVTALVLLLGRSRHGPSFTGPGPPLGGPEIRVQVVAAPVLVFAAAGPVRVVSLEESRVLYRGELPAPCLVESDGRELVVAGRRFPGAIRIQPLGGEPGLGEDGFPAGGRALAVGTDLPAGSRRGVAALEARWRKQIAALRAAGRSVFLVSPAGDAAPPRAYRGALELRPGEGVVEAVNALPLEAYLAGVIGSEIPARAPLEAVKAQCVASRTYALYALRRAKTRGRPGVFSSGPDFQVYRGLETEHPRVIRALRATHGEVLTYLGRLFRSYYHSTCGGQTARASLAFGEPDIPPLGGVSCEGSCDGSRFARWECRLDREKISTALRRRIGKRTRGASLAVGTLRSLELAETGADGRARYVRFEHDLGSLEWSAERFRRAVAPGCIRSTYFRVVEAETDGDYVVEGRGWGHGVGLCQVGCMKRGQTDSYRRILGHYYPRSEFRGAY
ncbi:MAG: SpoIID/LytB domain-containing protein [Planctomycetota bacterium]|nr:SpoIID/LytB domain-containing protein [Planctomycetota bacterium]